MTITEQLDALAELKAQLDLEMMNLQAQREIIMESVKERLAIAELAAQPTIDMLTASIAAREAQIKTAVIEAGVSVKGAHLQAVYSKGRASWDTKGLDGYAVAHPEINVFRSVGQPIVSIRKGGTE